MRTRLDGLRTPREQPRAPPRLWPRLGRHDAETANEPGQIIRCAQSRQMTRIDDDRFDAETVAAEFLHEFEGKESVITGGDDANVRGGPCVCVPAALEDRAALRGLSALEGGRSDRWRDVVKEGFDRVEWGIGVSTLGNGEACGGRPLAGVLPPLACALTECGNHGGDEDQEANG